MQRHAENIKARAGQYVAAARARGLERLEIVAGDIVRDLKLNGRVPAVCSALRSKQFQFENGITLERWEGPPSGQSTTVKFIYSLGNTPKASAASDFLALRGAGKSTYQALGGGAEFHRLEREGLESK